ncbi:DUF4148 domain-containing protein (plasmid) [Burkholderia pyrrocinia]|uniref:DUF4148 domain-containing protein n=1 Tax=Burkholderia pyrrocinia TaxID=60550 RepID=UPI0038B43B22
MEHVTLIKQSLFATVLLSAAVAAFAGGGGPRGPATSQYGHVNQVPSAQAATPSLIAAATPKADANGWPTTAQDTSAGGPRTDYGKTRDQVRAELLQAERAGLAPVNKNDYPPSATTIARNQARFQQIEQAWHGSAQVTASGQ